MSGFEVSGVGARRASTPCGGGAVERCQRDLVVERRARPALRATRRSRPLRPPSAARPRGRASRPGVQRGGRHRSAPSGPTWSLQDRPGGDRWAVTPLGAVSGSTSDAVSALLRASCGVRVTAPSVPTWSRPEPTRRTRGRRSIGSNRTLRSRVRRSPRSRRPRSVRAADRWTDRPGRQLRSSSCRRVEGAARPRCPTPHRTASAGSGDRFAPRWRRTPRGGAARPMSPGRTAGRRTLRRSPRR